VKLDHLVVAASDLDSGTIWLEEKLGVRLQPGGQHAFMGTHNRLLRLRDVYLEIITVDPNAPAPNRPRWFNLDALRFTLETPRLIHWVVNGDIDRAVQDSPEELGEITNAARGDFKWRITIPADGHLPGDGLVPTIIQWEGERPVTRMPAPAPRTHSGGARGAGRATARLARNASSVARNALLPKRTRDTGLSRLAL
jgi:Glyoxalase-like domain